MAQKFLTNINLNQNQLVNATFEVLATDPNDGNFEGRLIYNSTEDTIKVWSGSAWRRMVYNVSSTGANSSALTVAQGNGSVTLQLNLADASNAGLLTAAHFSDLTAATSDATPTTLVKRDVNGRAKIVTPTEAAHIATKGYVDAARQGLDVKQSVRAATTASVNLATDLEAGDVLDGVTLAAGDRILVKNQNGIDVHVDNGIYVVQASGAPVRASDSDGTADTGELSPGTFTFVEEGTVNSDKGFVISTNGTITVGSTAIAWTQFSGLVHLLLVTVLVKLATQSTSTSLLTELQSLAMRLILPPPTSVKRASRLLARLPQVFGMVPTSPSLMVVLAQAMQQQQERTSVLQQLLVR